MWSFQRNKLAAGKLSGRRPHIDMNMGAMAVSAANRSELNPGKVLALICALASASAAWAVPGTPSAPQVVFQEDFDNTGIVQPTLGPNGTSGTDPAQATMLHTYVSAAQDINGALGQTYIASGVYSGDVNVPFWENAQWCNGIWMKGDVAGSQPYPTAELPAPYVRGVAGANGNEPKYCSGNGYASPQDSWKWLQVLSNVLGQVTKSTSGPADASAAGNHAIAAFTNLPLNRAAAAGTPANVVIETVKPIPVRSGGRFVTFSVATAAMGCAGPTKDPKVYNPQFNFNLIDLTNSNVVELTPVAVDPCTQGALYDGAQLPAPASSYGGNKPGVYAGQIFGSKTYKLAGNSVKLQVTSENSNGDSNDAAFDNLLLIDVTPQLDKSFAPAAISRGQNATLTFTITNSSSQIGCTGATCPLLEASGWEFSDTLPAGLVFASPANAQTSCGAGTSVGTSGTNVLNVTNGLIGAGVASCTVTVGVALDPAVAIPAGGLDLTNGPAVPGGPTTGPGVITTLYLNSPSSATIKALPSADMLAVPAASQVVKAGTPVTVTTQCRNAGPDVAVQATCLVSGIPPDAGSITQSCVPASGSASLNPGEAIVCTTTFTPQTPGTVSLLTVAGSTSTDPVPANNEAPSPVNVVVLAADMQATSAVTQTVKVGTPVTVSTQCVNLGPDDAAAATCRVDGVPADATAVSQSCVPASGSTGLKTGAAITCTTTFTPAKAETVTLTTVAGSSTPDLVTSNNQAPSVVVAATTVADMQATGPVSVPIVVGTPVSVTTTCTNAGPDAAATAACTVTGAPAGATTVCTPQPPVTSLARGASISCVTSFTPDSATSVTLTTTASSTTPDSNMANNTAVTTLGVGTGVAAVPTLSRWALMLLSVLLAGFAAMRMRRVHMN